MKTSGEPSDGGSCTGSAAECSIPITAFQKLNSPRAAAMEAEPAGSPAAMA